MQNSRRIFLKNTALLATTAAVMPHQLLAESKKLQRIVLQLYSVRDDMQKDTKGTLKKIADLGYSQVEHAGYNDRKFYGFSVKEFKTILNDLDLKMPSGHTGLNRQHWNTATNDFTDAWKHTVEDAAELGQRFVLSPSLGYGVDMTAESVKPLMDQYNKSGELCKKYGMKFGYHNHEFEFTSKIGDMPLFDYMLQNTDPALVTYQLDMGNMYAVGAKALDYINKYPGRFELLHVKDAIRVDAPADAKPKYESCVLGKGEVPLQQILKAAKKVGGTTHLVVEQESYQGLAPIASVGLDLKMMKKWGY
ncbi:sugar phosphate isomerase/epimerase [Mucilaginibacter hurinus]|uniref:Sugar phosphate isomerase/epimerase n=1 Tax=Mucilaginibacter hurinus TaxID=2201324 RepID=A0A367GRM8_9SPHI|nr:sugar phosphate isomerase/epimerase [Mucilaginibacter hurinus]RCH55373.1 sugar phosphate isomerase/epimerase [Mucilaginibacter hurinus]